MMPAKTFCAANRSEWRAWLEKYYASETEVWLIYFKEPSGKTSIPYEDSVEEALCFGWIDSIIKKIDEEKYVRKFTPRKNQDNWSALKKRRAAKMIQAGLMTEAGLVKITFPIEEAAGDTPKAARELALPENIRKALMQNPSAWENFNRLAPSYRRQYIGWITSARREETWMKRIQEAIELLEKNQKLGMR